MTHETESVLDNAQQNPLGIIRDFYKQKQKLTETHQADVAPLIQTKNNIFFGEMEKLTDSDPSLLLARTDLSGGASLFTTLKQTRQNAEANPDYQETTEELTRKQNAHRVAKDRLRLETAEKLVENGLSILVTPLKFGRKVAYGLGFAA